ncbi:hypothetical protein BG004_007876 [Podila humilis]|nr:hypothetical protein BG004_007876 [Podila humilis]
MAKFTSSFLLLLTLALLATVAAQETPSPSPTSAATSTTTTPAGSGTTSAPTGPRPSFTSSIDFSSLAGVISSYASARPPAPTNTGADGKGSGAGVFASPQYGVAALLATVAVFAAGNMI